VKKHGRLAWASKDSRATALSFVIEGQWGSAKEDDSRETDCEAGKPVSIEAETQERTFYLSRVKSLGEGKRLWGRMKPFEVPGIRWSYPKDNRSFLSKVHGRREDSLKELSDFFKASKRWSENLKSARSL